MTESLRLLFLTKDFPSPYQPTKGVFNAELVRALAAQHRVQVIAPVPWVAEWQARRRGVTASPRDELAVCHPRFYYLPGLLHGWHGSFLWWSVQSTVRTYLQEERPDAVIAYWAHPDGEVAVRAARLAGVPAVVMVGGSDVLLLTANRQRRQCILKVLHEADAVVTVGRHLCSKLIELGLPPDKVHVVERGVDTGRFYPGDRQQARQRLGIAVQGRLLLFVGRLVPVKGLDVLLEACTLLRQRGEDIHLMLVGDGPLRSPLEADCNARGLHDQVTFAGAVPHNRLADWYRAADLTVLPSRSEGIPNVLRESLACGTTFVASNVGGIPEVADEAHSRLVPPEDPTSLAEAICTMLAKRPTVRWEQGSWEASAESLVAIVRSLLPTKRTPTAIEPPALATIGEEHA